MSFVIQQQVSLQAYNTLALPGRAEYFCDVSSMDGVEEALAFARAEKLPVTTLGGGSNMVVAGDIKGLVVHLNLSGLNATPNRQGVELALAAGENWHSAVTACVQRGWFGLENLSLIPGNAGAAPIQNIGAYGVELADLFVSLHAVDVGSGEIVTLSKDDCRFGYRDSVFKHQLKDRLMITQINLQLSCQPRVNLDYAALRDAMQDAEEVTPLTVSETVCRIRRNKLPDPAVLANAGSFYKNPCVDGQLLEKLLARYPDIVYYPQTDGRFKLAAGWLIERCGLKGVQRGPVAVHERKALVLVNHGGATGSQLLALSEEITGAVADRFAVELQVEPRIYGID